MVFKSKKTKVHVEFHNFSYTLTLSPFSGYVPHLDENESEKKPFIAIKYVRVWSFLQNDSHNVFHFRPNNYHDVSILVNFVRTKTQYQPTVGIICGSGLGKIVNLLEQPDVLPYDDIPGFPISTGKLLYFSCVLTIV